MNHPHESQSAAMARAGELPDGEQLRECINSGQVSAAQVVAHAGAGELSMSMFASREDFDKAVAHQEAVELPPLPEPLEIEWPSLHPHGLGCGVEDRDITDRYEAAEYGWQNGVDRAAECVPDDITPLKTCAPTPPQP